MIRHRSSISDEEQIERYVYALGVVSVSVADRAFAAVFASMPQSQREGATAEIIAHMPEGERPSRVEDPWSFAALMRNLHARIAVTEISAASSLARAFVGTAPVVAYFTSGVGSLTIDRQPPWVHELAGHETAPIDGGRVHHRKGASWGPW